MKNIVCYPGYYSDLALGTRHCNLVVLIRNTTIRAYFVVVFLNAPSWFGVSKICWNLLFLNPINAKMSTMRWRILTLLLFHILRLPVVTWITTMVDWVSLSARLVMNLLFLTIWINHPNGCFSWWIAAYFPAPGLAELPNDFYTHGHSSPRKHRKSIEWLRKQDELEFQDS